MLQPSASWYWYIDQPSQNLTISLNAEMCFSTPYKANSVRLPTAPNTSFSLCDMEHYVELAECLEQSNLNFNAAEKTQILLNATAAISFHKPLAAKSWYFDRQTEQGEFHRVAILQNAFSEGLVLVLYSEQATATCMLISNEFQLDENNKKLVAFELIKVMTDRLQPYLPQICQQKSA